MSVVLPDSDLPTIEITGGKIFSFSIQIGQCLSIPVNRKKLSREVANVKTIQTTRLKAGERPMTVHLIRHGVC